jgi:hypothetical protein
MRGLRLYRPCELTLVPLKAEYHMIQVTGALSDSADLQIVKGTDTFSGGNDKMTTDGRELFCESDPSDI